MDTDDRFGSKRFCPGDDSTISHDSSTVNLRSFFCPYCTFNTQSNDDLDFHLHTHHQHVCSECFRQYPSYFLLDLHMSEVHNCYSTTSQYYRCLIESCPERFTDTNQRYRHMIEQHHIRDNPFDDVFLSFSNMQIDSRTPRADEKKFGCDSQKTFLRNPRLIQRRIVDTNWDGDDG